MLIVSLEKLLLLLLVLLVRLSLMMMKMVHGGRMVVAHQEHIGGRCVAVDRLLVWTAAAVGQVLLLMLEMLRLEVGPRERLQEARVRHGRVARRQACGHVGHVERMMVLDQRLLLMLIRLDDFTSSTSSCSSIASHHEILDLDESMMHGQKYGALLLTELAVDRLLVSVVVLVELREHLECADVVVVVGGRGVLICAGLV